MTQVTFDLQATAAAEAPEDELTARRAQELCAHLLIHRWLPKRSTRDLMIDDGLRRSVDRRLAGVGLQLIDSYTSNYFAVRLLPAIEGDVRFDWSTNARLPRGAVALLVILWTRLVLPRRVASDEARRARDDAQQRAIQRGEDPALADAAQVQGDRLPAPTVARTALYAEFGHRFGKIAFARYLSQLKSAGLVLENRAGLLREGPLLDVLVDGVTMARKLRDSVLWDLLERDGGAAHEPEIPGLTPTAAPAAPAGSAFAVAATGGASSDALGAAAGASRSEAGSAAASDADDAPPADGEAQAQAELEAIDDDFDDWADDA